ncbi:MAG: hypothetical protein GW947_01100 [Candidatus Pacebacteria bacterium]|nr:hypothetical protein [Candidatus Paceibacterota bacterium]
MQKARSRLADQPEPERVAGPVWWKKYIRTAPFGLLGVISIAALLYILTKIPPAQIADMPLPNTYGPFLLASFFTSFCVLGYLLQSARKGLFIALILTLLLFLHLQHVFIGKYDLV